MTFRHRETITWKIIRRGGMRRNAPILFELHDCSEIFAATIARAWASALQSGILLMQSDQTEQLHSKYYPNDIRHNLSTFHFERYDAQCAQWVPINNPKRQRI